MIGKIRVNEQENTMLKHLNFALLATFFATGCSSASPTEASNNTYVVKEITPELVTSQEQAEKQCLNQVAFILAVEEKKEAGVPEKEVLQALTRHRNVSLEVGNEFPWWLYVRYAQVTRDIYRRDRDIQSYGEGVYRECIVGGLYLTKEDDK